MMAIKEPVLIDLPIGDLTQEKSVLMLKYIGEDFWSCPVYSDQFGKLWKNIELRQSSYPSLYSVSNNEFDGEPDSLIRQEFIIQSAPQIDDEKKFRYMMLGRCKSDCEYFLGYGDRSPGRLYAGTPQDQIKTMKKIWISFAEDEKPEWLTWEQLLQYEKEMCSDEP